MDNAVQISGYPGYFVDSDGNVWSLWERKKGRGAGKGRFIGSNPTKLRRSINSSGYQLVTMKSEGGRQVSHNVHRLVLEAFAGPCPHGMEACHEDGDRANCSLSNLRWDTHSGNMKDKSKHGTQLKGSMIPSSKLSEPSVIEIRGRIENGESVSCLAVEYGLCRATVYEIKRRKIWKWL